ncbi:MAG TPA: hypothetical protein VGF69_25275 [Thermoanaerobaculia bacterium]|jgi:hypothetical protein
MRMMLAVLLLVATAVSAEPPKATAKPAPKPVAPETMPHPMALFLSSLSGDGKQQVTFKATAVGTRFFFEEPGGVTIYRWDNGGYKKEEFVRNTTLAKVLKKYTASVDQGATTGADGAEEE